MSTKDERRMTAIDAIRAREDARRPKPKVKPVKPEPTPKPIPEPETEPEPVKEE